MNFSYIDKMDNKIPSIIFARHAERHEVESLNSHHEVLLTEKGINDSRIFGEHIAGKFDQIKVFHSPISRCRQTAENIIKGIIENNGNAETGGELSWLLGDYMFDKKTIDNCIKTYEVNTFLRNWFDGKFSREIITPINEIAAAFIKSITEQLKNDNGLIIDISHDWNMSVILEYFLGLKHENIGIPSFLDHIIISERNDKINMTYHEYSVEI